jgi:hypothetical protein
MVFPKTSNYVMALCCVHKMLFDKSRETRDQKLYGITVVLLSYIKNACDELGIDTRTLAPTDKFDLGPIYEYVRVNQIHLYDLTAITDGDIDPLNESHVERFILSHINYIFTRPAQH